MLIFDAFVQILLNLNLSFNQTSPTFLLCVRKFGWLNWFWQFLCDGLSSFNQKIFYYSYAWSCSLSERMTSFCTAENSADSYLSFRLGLLHSLSYFFFFYQSPSSSLCTVFDSISSNIDEILSINPSANVFHFGDFNVHHKDWLIYSGATHRPGEPC